MGWIKIKLRQSLTPSFSSSIGNFAHVFTVICDDQAIKLELQTSNIFLWNFLREESFDSFQSFMDKSSNKVFKELEYFFIPCQKIQRRWDLESEWAERGDTWEKDLSDVKIQRAVVNFSMTVIPDHWKGILKKTLDILRQF